MLSQKKRGTFYKICFFQHVVHIFLYQLINREEWMAAIENVSERLFDSESTDVDMSCVPEEKDQMLKESSSSSSLSSSMVSSPMDPENEKFQKKFLVTGTSSRQHHSGRKKVVCTNYIQLVD